MPARQLYETFTGDGITDGILADASRLFGDNYGVWGPKSHLPGARVKMSSRLLRLQCIPTGGGSSYVRVTIDDELAGNAFACRWQQGDKTICWITQLVLDRHYRERGIAGLLLKTLVEDTDDMYGIMSSHPAACLAAMKAFGTTLDRVSLEFTKKNAEQVMAASPVSYVRDAKLAGEMFGIEADGLVSGGNTFFFVDHDEPIKALEQIQNTWDWPLGQLPEGHEFLLLLPHRRRGNMQG